MVLERTDVSRERYVFTFSVFTFSKVTKVSLYSRRHLADKGFPTFGIKLGLSKGKSYTLYEERGCLAESNVHKKAEVLVKEVPVILEDRTKKNPIGKSRYNL